MKRLNLLSLIEEYQRAPNRREHFRYLEKELPEEMFEKFKRKINARFDGFRHNYSLDYEKLPITTLQPDYHGKRKK